MSTKSTPGPWAYECGRVYEASHPKDTNGFRTGFFLLDADRRSTNEQGRPNPTPPAERDANLRLAAQAPELLSIVRRLIRSLEAHIADDATRNNVKPEWYCPCTLDELADARKLLEFIDA